MLRHWVDSFFIMILCSLEVQKHLWKDHFWKWWNQKWIIRRKTLLFSSYEHVRCGSYTNLTEGHSLTAWAHLTGCCDTVKLQASFDNPLEWAPQLEKTWKATKLTKLPSECHGQPASQHFSIFCFSSSGCHRRGWHRRTWWTQTSESSDREVGERQGWTPWETCTFVRGIFALYVNLYLCKTEHCCVVLLESRYSLSRGGESKTLHQVQEDSGWWAWRRLRLVLQRPRRRQPAISTDLRSGNCFQSFMRPCDSPFLGQ